MAITLKNKNFAKSTLASGITAGATLLTVATGDGVKFPATGSFRAVIWTAANSSPTNDSTREIVTVTAVAGDVLTITRAAESTTAKAWVATDHIAHVITAGKIDELEADIIPKVSDPAIRDISRGLIIKNNTTNPNYQVDVDADEIILQDSSGIPYKATAVNLTADITVNGINGCPRAAKTGTATSSATTVTGTGTLFTTEFAIGDVIWFNTTGVGRRITAIASDISLTIESSLTIAVGEAISNGGEAPDTRYYIWVIYNGTTVASILSTSSTAPTMPSGYTYKALLGAIYNNSSSNFFTTYQQGNKVRCDGIALINITATVMTITTLNIPVTAKKVSFIAYPNWASNFIMMVHPLQSYTNVTYFYVSVVSGLNAFQGDCLIETPQTVYAQNSVAGNNFYFYVKGWEY